MNPWARATVVAFFLASCGAPQTEAPAVSAMEAEALGDDTVGAVEAEPTEAAPANREPLPPHARVRPRMMFSEDYSFCVASGEATYCWPAYRMATVPNGQPEWPRALDLDRAPVRVPIEARCLAPGAIVGEETTLAWLNLEHPSSPRQSDYDDCVPRSLAERLHEVAEGEITSYPPVSSPNATPASTRFAVVGGAVYFRDVWSDFGEQRWEPVPSVDDAIEITDTPTCVRTTAGEVRCWNRVRMTSTVTMPDALRQNLAEAIPVDERVVDISADEGLCFVTEGGRVGCLCPFLDALPCAEGEERTWIPNVDGALQVQLKGNRLCVLTDDRLVCYHAGRRTEARLDALAERAEPLSLPPLAGP